MLIDNLFSEQINKDIKNIKWNKYLNINLIQKNNIKKLPVQNKKCNNMLEMTLLKYYN